MTAAELITALEDFDDIAVLAAIGGAVHLRIAALASSNGKADDELIDVHEAARILGLSESQLYHGDFPFEVKGRGQGRKRLFSRAGIQRYIRRNQSG
jgi:hypothetical protein